MSVVAVLSAYREPDGEFAKRDSVAQLLKGRKVYPLGAHTRHEADIVLDASPGESSITVVTSGYHGERAFLTFVQALRERGLQHVVRVRVVQTEMCATPEREREKIRRYQASGDCASYEHADEYVAHWLLKEVCET